MIKRLFFILLLAFAAPPALADTTFVRGQILNELREDGYEEVRISRTLLGRMRFVATNNRSRREIVVNPITGVILRDYIRFLRGSDDDDENESVSDDDKGDDDGNDDDDDEEDDDEEEDEEDEDDEDDEVDNSGSGSSNSGSGSGDDREEDD